MVSNNPEQPRHKPFDIVLLAYEFFNVPDNGAVQKEGLIRVMLTAGCPRRDVAERILERMTEFGLLLKRIDSDGVEAFSRTPRGIRETPKLGTESN